MLATLMLSLTLCAPREPAQITAQARVLMFEPKSVVSVSGERASSHRGTLTIVGKKAYEDRIVDRLLSPGTGRLLLSPTIRALDGQRAAMVVSQGPSELRIEIQSSILESGPVRFRTSVEWSVKSDAKDSRRQSAFSTEELVEGEELLILSRFESKQYLLALTLRREPSRSTRLIRIRTN